MQENITLGRWKLEDLHKKNVEFCILTPESFAHGVGVLVVSELPFQANLFHAEIDLSHRISPGEYVSRQIELTQREMDCLEEHPEKPTYHFRLVSLQSTPLPVEALFVLQRMGIDTNAFH